MEKVLNQAELLAESILGSDEFINMRLCEQAVMKDEEATGLIAAYTEKRQSIESLLADANMDRGELAKAGEALEMIEKQIDQNALVAKMRENREKFNDMMKQVNSIIRFVVTGEKDDEPDGCTGSCESCGGGCHHH